MAPATRASTKKTTTADARDIVSWTSEVSGEILYYERFHVYEDAGEVLFMQIRATDDGELVPWTIDSEDEDKGAAMTDDSRSEAGEADPDFVPEADTEFVLEEYTDFDSAEQRPQRRRTIKAKATIPSSTPYHPAPSHPAPVYHAPSYPASIHYAPSYAAPFHHAPPFPAPFYYAPSYPDLSLSDLLLAASAVPVDQPFLPAAHHPAAPVVNSTEDMVELEEGEAVLELAIGPFSEAVLRKTSRCSLPSLLRNFRLSDLSEVNGADAHAIEKDFHDTIRPGRFRANRWVLDPRPTIFRPTNPDYKEIAAMGPY